MQLRLKAAEEHIYFSQISQVKPVQWGGGVDSLSFKREKIRQRWKVSYEILQLVKDSRTETIVRRDPVASFDAQQKTYLCIWTNKHNLTAALGWM